MVTSVESHPTLPLTIAYPVSGHKYYLCYKLNVVACVYHRAFGVAGIIETKRWDKKVMGKHKGVTFGEGAVFVIEFERGTIEVRPHYRRSFTVTIKPENGEIEDWEYVDDETGFVKI